MAFARLPSRLRRHPIYRGGIWLSAPQSILYHYPQWWMGSRRFPTSVMKARALLTAYRASTRANLFVPETGRSCHLERHRSRHPRTLPLCGVLDVK
ncbi:hypothetical protein AVEN_62630-1 [Araneus ventricosus]|uniref:Uncharacterized protein n=1 Tax=Araneus ventricosus TaxID=182803 RepID=A0A4Y2H3L2_ARAVE|nr:hypothetical protein AVEN_62630-1 [Araneus ventricosus]